MSGRMRWKWPFSGMQKTATAARPPRAAPVALRAG